MKTTLSKNAPCPCGSKKKYKKCCMGKIAKNQEEYYGLLHKEGIIKNKLVRWASQNFSHEELDEYAHDFNGKKFENLESLNEITNFFDWFFLEAVHKQKKEKILGIIINEFSDLFDQDEISILNEWANNTHAGIFEVEEIDKNNWEISLKEIFTDKKYCITDRKASEQFIIGDITFVRVQKIFSNYYLSGAGRMYPRFTVLDQLKEFVTRNYNLEKQRNPGTTYEEFMNASSKILNDFNPEEPKIITEEGEEVKLCEAIYSIDSNKTEKILNWFDSDEDFLITDEDYEGDKLKSANVAILKTRINKSRAKNYRERGIVVFEHFTDEKGKKVATEGSIDINGGELKIFTNSERVLKRLEEKLDKNIGQYLKTKTERIQLVKEAIESREDEEVESKKSTRYEALERKFMRQYYKEWCYQKIPALGNISPKEAVKTEEGREALRQLLIEFENHEQHKKREGGKYFPAVNIIRDELNFYD